MLIGEIRNTSPYAAYTWGPDGIVSRRDLVGNTSSWYEFGPQGETRTLTSATGAVSDTYYYNAYGETISSAGTTINPYRYGAKFGYYTEAFTGLVLATQRWYSPQLMRWITRDPIGYDGGENLYSYVGQSPVRWVDPSGLHRVVFEDGKVKYYDDDNNIVVECGATSGRDGCQDVCMANKGPIPKGDYTLDPNMISKGGFFRNFWGDWGKYRVPLDPKSGTYTCGRCNFFLHGGKTPGTAGCIDVGSCEDKIFPQLKNHIGPVDVKVK